MAKYPHSHIRTSGHSLGAALSLISALEISKKYPFKIDYIYNYGCPRIGNPRLTQEMTKRFINIFRIIHNADIFPHLPPMELEYRHAPYEVFYDENFEHFKVCDKSGEDKTCSTSLYPKYKAEDHHFYFYTMFHGDC